MVGPVLGANVGITEVGITVDAKVEKMDKVADSTKE